MQAPFDVLFPTVSKCMRSFLVEILWMKLAREKLSERQVRCVDRPVSLQTSGGSVRRRPMYRCRPVEH
jgi:hypothetical protein